MKTLFEHINNVRYWNILVGHVDPDIVDQRHCWNTDEQVREKALDLIEEEVAELRQAVEEQDDVEILDALADILFTVFGLASKSGHDEILEAGLSEVIRSNMTKVTGEKGSGRVKIGKPEGYEPPKIAEIVHEARERGYLES